MLIIYNTNPELALPLAILTETEDNALRNEIKFNLNSIGSNYPIKCVEIIQRWLKNTCFKSGTDFEGFCNNTKGDAKIVDGFLRSWIAEEKNYKILMFGLPDLLQKMFYWSDREASCRSS